MDKVLIDTNILIYAYDQRVPAKQQKAIEILEYLSAMGNGVITTQILSEFYVVATGKLDPPLEPAQAEAQLLAFLAQWHVLSVTEAVVMLAVFGTQEYKMHFWDAQIWAAARLHGITTVFSEDFSSGAIIDGVRFVNPLLHPSHPFQSVDS